MKRSLVYGSAALALAASAGLAQTVTLDNGIVGDGQLIVKPDAYGAYSNWTLATNNEDFYDPNGPVGSSIATFACGWYLYDPDDAVVFAEPNWDLDNLYNFLNFGTFDIPTIINPLVAFDTDGDLIDDTATSSWTSSNTLGAGDLTFEFALTQEVKKPDANGVSEFKETLVITNRSGGSRTFTIQRHHDNDLLFDGTFEDESGSVNGCVGVNPPNDITIYMSDPDGTNDTSVAMVGSPGYDYCAGRGRWDPDGPGPDPEMAYGTDFQIWNNFGYPPSWRNMTAGIGAAPATGVVPGAMPAPFTSPFDGFSNLDWELTLANGASATLSFSSLYGTDGSCQPACAPCACDWDGDPVCTLFDFLAFQTAFVGADPCACGLDGNPACTLFDFLEFQNQFVSGCP